VRHSRCGTAAFTERQRQHSLCNATYAFECRLGVSRGAGILGLGMWIDFGMQTARTRTPVTTVQPVLRASSSARTSMDVAAGADLSQQASQRSAAGHPYCWAGTFLGLLMLGRYA
jgi:hypothetical protein